MGWFKKVFTSLQAWILMNSAGMRTNTILEHGF